MEASSAARLWTVDDSGSQGGAPAGVSTETILLVVAQCLFMLLPITGLYTMRAGNPAKLVGARHQQPASGSSSASAVPEAGRHRAIQYLLTVP
jgi:hypothetical protein